MDSSDSSEFSYCVTLPSAAEVEQVFKEYKQMLQVSRFQSPLRRANELQTRQSLIALSQKTQWEAEHVFNLLPPGHRTCLKVDFFRILLNCEQHIYLRIPTTLLNANGKVTLLRNSPSGQVIFKTFPSAKTAFPFFEADIAKAGIGKPYFPRYIHKASGCVSALYNSQEVALRAWQDASDTNQRLQQFVQPLTKSVSLVRAHWRESQRMSMFYFISHGPVKTKNLVSLIHQVPTLGRSLSEANLQCGNACINRSSSNLIIQRAKEIPELDKSLQECVRLLNSTLKSSQHVSELVCDFVSDSSHQWVFIGCRGFAFVGKDKIRTKTVEQKQIIDLKFLMFPLLARKSIVKRKLEKTRKHGTGGRRRMAIWGVTKKQGNESLDASPLIQGEPEPKSFSSLAKPPRPESVILEREVHRYDSLVKGSREYKEIVKSTVDIVEKYGGSAYWRPALSGTYNTFHNHSEIAPLYFEESIGFEEHSQIVNSLLRIIRGDYNFYYKEMLRKLHSRLGISKVHFQQFLHELEQIFEGAEMSEADLSITMLRFQQLEEYICPGEARKSRGSEV